MTWYTQRRYEILRGMLRSLAQFKTPSTLVKVLKFEAAFCEILNALLKLGILAKVETLRDFVR